MNKRDSKILYGLAAFLLVFHHVFKGSNPSGIEEHSVLMICAWIAKICVAIYAFISGYGLTIKFSDKKNQDANLSVKSVLTFQYKEIGISILKFLSKYWLVFFIFIPLLILHGDIVYNTKIFIGNFLGLFFDYNGAWWYIRQYYIMMVIFPIIFLIINKISKTSSRIIVITYICSSVILGFGYVFKIPILFQLSDSIIVTYTMIFIQGMLVAKYNVFAKLSERHMSIHIVIVMLLSCIAFRIALTRNPGDCLVDLPIITIFIFSFLKIFSKSPISRPLMFLGKYSTFLWLTHCFYIKFIPNPRILNVGGVV